MVKVAVLVIGLIAGHASADPPRPPYPLEFEEVPLGIGRPGGYVTIGLGSISSLYSHVAVGVDVAKALPRAPWLLARVRALFGGPFGTPLSHRHPPNGSRTEIRIGLELRDCRGSACLFAGLDGGYYAESIKSCDGQECIVVDARDEQGLFPGGSAGIDFGSGRAGFRVALEAFGTPDNTVGFGAMFGLTVHLWHDRDALVPARRRTIAFARAERTAAQADCSHVEQASKQLAREDAGIRDVFDRDPYVARCLQEAAKQRIAARAREEAAKREAMERQEAAARDAHARAITERARRRIEADPCLARKAALLRALRETSDPMERGRIVAAFPDCD